ncbi:MAG: alpha-L-fucosidase [Thalassotalea sp.]|nr:alpha-L-fucosidase [Thalassotalea sp.]
MVRKILLVTLLFSAYSFAQQDANSTVEQKQELSWEQLRDQYEFPSWYTEARFGIWSVWGPQSQEYGGGWYARNMYKQHDAPKWADKVYSHHLNNYGHPSEHGYKDLIHQWKAENLDTNALMKYFKSLGARYFMVLANHHEHYDLWNSSHHEWNSVNVGPKRDIVGEWKIAADKYDMPFAVTVHDDRFLRWWKDAFGADNTGPKKGVPYDGRLTKADGKGKWWQGLDPAKLYGLPPEERTPAYIEEVGKHFEQRHKELVTKYDVDMLWYDGHGFPYGKYGKEVSRTLFANSLKKHGKIQAVMAGKFYNQESSIVEDIERGGANEIKLRPWQSITNLSSWYYTGAPFGHNARSMIEMMSDVFSKNGNLVLNVELKLDGTIPAHHKPILDEIGHWVNVNGKAIYASNPWKIYGDNLGSSELSAKELLAQAEEADLGHYRKLAAEKEQYNERKKDALPYGSNEVRFTTKGDKLYIFVLNPKAGTIELPSLGNNSPQEPSQIKEITMIGSEQPIEFRQNGDALLLTVPTDRPTGYTTVFEVSGAL